jgi:hypothetical protein
VAKRDKEKNLLEDYFFGRLSEDQEASLEKRLLEDDDFFEYAQAVEEELIDDYARGEIPFEGRLQFETRFLNTPRRRKKEVEARLFNKALHQVAGEIPMGRPVTEVARSLQFVERLRTRLPRLAAPLAAALALVLAGCVLLAIYTFNLRDDLDRAGAERAERQQQLDELIARATDQAARAERAMSELAEEKARREAAEREASRAGSGFISQALRPGALRSIDEATVLVIPKQQRMARLLLEIEEGGYLSYTAVLSRIDGPSLYRKSGLAIKRAGSGQAVEFLIPEKILKDGSYIITLSGRASDGSVEEIDYYYFRVLNH